MEEKYPDKSYKGFLIWMALFCVLMIGYALADYGALPLSLNAGEGLGLLLLLLLDLLFLIIYVTQSVYWIGGVTYEQAKEAGEQARKRYALRHLLVFLAATALFFLYCFWLNGIHPTGLIKDSLAAGGLICAAAIATMPIRL